VHWGEPLWSWEKTFLTYETSEWKKGELKVQDFEEGEKPSLSCAKEIGRVAIGNRLLLGHNEGKASSRTSSIGREESSRTGCCQTYTEQCMLQKEKSTGQ